MDTQWPVFFVFDQNKLDQTLEHVGSVHAPDGEMALLNARDVFARRSTHENMWVVPVNRILVIPTQINVDSNLGEILPEAMKNPGVYHLFAKYPHHQLVNYVASVWAGSAELALVHMMKILKSSNPIFWWVISEDCVTRTSVSDRSAMLGSATEKPFRHQSYYHVVTMMKKIKAQKKKDQ